MKKPLIAALLTTSAALLFAMPTAHAASGRDVAAGLILGGIVGAAIASQPRVVERQVVVQQPAVVYPVAQPIYQPVAPQVVQPAQCYYPGPPAAYGPCPGGPAYQSAPQPQSYVVPQPQVVYTQPTVVYTEPAVIYTSPRYYAPRPAFGYYHHGGHRSHGHGHGGISIRY